MRQAPQTAKNGAATVSTIISDAKPTLRHTIQAEPSRGEGANSPDAKVELNCWFEARVAEAERGFQASLRMGTA
jgi:hypothetical protein